ncbi:MAG: 50S ribosomal protein L30 [Myxococcota bacterium]
MAGKFRVKLLRSGINRPKDQKLTLRGLGLSKIGRSVLVDDTAPIRGMIFRVQHLVKVERAAEATK